MEKTEILRSHRDDGDEEKGKAKKRKNMPEKADFWGPRKCKILQKFCGAILEQNKKIYFASIFGLKKRIFGKKSINFKSWFFWPKMPPIGE